MRFPSRARFLAYLLSLKLYRHTCTSSPYSWCRSRIFFWCRSRHFPLPSGSGHTHENKKMNSLKLSSMCKSASQVVHGRMQLTLHVIRRRPHCASGLGQAMSAWWVKTRRAPSRHCGNARVYGHTTKAMPEKEYPFPTGCSFYRSFEEHH